MSNRVDGLDAVIDVINLPLPRKFPLDEFVDDVFLERGNVGLDRHAGRGGGVDLGYRTDADKRHLKGSRDWSRGKG